VAVASPTDRATARRGVWSAAAVLWGLAEATLFFIVPDVLLSYATLRRGLRAALLTGVLAVAGALLGGAAMYLWGRYDPAAAEAALDRIPAIDAVMIAKVAADLGDLGTWSLFAGAFGGVPYKIFAVEAGRIALDPVAFLATSAPARYARFAITVLVTALARHALARIGQERRSTAILAGFWICFYVFYFALVSA